MKPRVLFIAYFYPPVGGVGLPGAQRTVKFLRNLDIEEAHVLTSTLDSYPSYMALDNQCSIPIRQESVHRAATFDLFGALLRTRARIKNFLGGKKDSIEQRKNHENQNISKPPSVFQGIKDAISLLLTYPDFARPWLLSAIWWGVGIVRRHRLNTIFATGMPWTSLIVGTCLKWLTGAKLIIDFRDPWVDNPFFGHKSGLEKRLDRFCESLAVRTADIVAVNTEPLRQEFETRYPGACGKLLWLPNGFDEADFRDITPCETPPDKLVLAHAGLLYIKRDPSALLSAMAFLMKNRPEIGKDILFRQIGGVQLSYSLEQFCHEQHITSNVQILGQKSHRECLSMLSGADILLLLQPGTRTQVPSKLYEYMCINKPILTITEEGGALGQLIEENHLGRLFQPGEIEALADYLADLVEAKRQGGSAALVHPPWDRSKFDIITIARTLQKHMEMLSLSNPGHVTSTDMQR